MACNRMTCNEMISDRVVCSHSNIYDTMMCCTMIPHAHDDTTCDTGGYPSRRLTVRPQP